MTRLRNVVPAVAMVAAILGVSSCSSTAKPTATPSGTTGTSAAGSASTGTGSTGTGSTQSLAGQTITLYSAQHEQTTDAIVKAFTAKTGIKVKVDSNDEDVLTAQIEQEASRSPADVFYTENSNWLQQLDDKGLLAQTDPATLADVPARDNSTDGTWTGVSARISAIVYNPSKIAASALPTSILDMADPKYKGMFEMAPAETDFWPLIVSVEKAKGMAAAEAWLEGMKSNAGSNDSVPDNETVTSDIEKGNTAFAVINHYYYYRAIAEAGKSATSKLAYFAPQDPGFVDSVSGVAVLKSSRHQAAAQELLSFMTSEAGQSVLAQGESFEYPLKTGVAANAALPPFTSYATNDFTPAELGTGLDAKTLLQQASLI